MSNDQSLCEHHWPIPSSSWGTIIGVDVCSKCGTVAKPWHFTGQIPTAISATEQDYPRYGKEAKP